MEKAWTIPLIALFSVVACAGGPGGLLREATGSVSQSMCSKVFISGFAPEDIMRDHLRPEPGMGLIAWALHYDVDRSAREVRTTVFGGSASRAVFREGRGCTLTYSGVAEPDAISLPPPEPALLPEIADAALVEPQDPALIAALDAAFAEPNSGAQRNTQAIVVVRHGRVIAERYAPGLSPTTPLLSHSIAKSVVNALTGVLVGEGRLRTSDRAPIESWADEGRANITIDNLLRMNAGFGFDEGSGSSAATRIWYTSPDMAREAAAAALKDTPGARWGYCSRCFIALSRIIGDAIGGGPQGVRDFAQRALFAPLGMSSVTLEFDASGTMMGANAMFATPRDWARFGLLYLNDGVVAGRRILPEGWVEYSTRPTGDAGYGAGFWLNTTHAEIEEWRMPWGLPGAPADTFMARGYMGQYIVAVPSADLVVVRFGQSHARAADVVSVGALVTAIIANSR